jgi:hypothetical protein
MHTYFRTNHSQSPEEKSRQCADRQLTRPASLLQVTPTCSSVARSTLSDQDSGVLRGLSDPAYNTLPVRTGCGGPADSYLTLRGTRAQTAAVDLSESQGTVHATKGRRYGAEYQAN